MKRPKSAEKVRQLPIFCGQRLVVWQWQIDELERMLGAFSDVLRIRDGLDGWLAEADERAMRVPDIIPDLWRWLRLETVREARMRTTGRSEPFQGRRSDCPSPAHWQDYFERSRCTHDPPCPTRDCCWTVKEAGAASWPALVAQRKAQVG